jgi:hypothetical protein
LLSALNNNFSNDPFEKKKKKTGRTGRATGHLPNSYFIYVLFYVGTYTLHRRYISTLLPQTYNHLLVIVVQPFTTTITQFHQPISENNNQKKKNVCVCVFKIKSFPSTLEEQRLVYTHRHF